MIEVIKSVVTGCVNFMRGVFFDFGSWGFSLFDFFMFLMLGSVLAAVVNKIFND